MRRFAKPTCPIRTDRFSRVLFALGTAQLQPHSLICSLKFSKSSAGSSERHDSSDAVVDGALDGFAKALNHIGLSRAALVFEGYEETACMRRVVAVVPARPGIDVKNSARRNYHVAGVTNVVSEARCAKTDR